MILQVHSPQSYSSMYPPTHPSQPQINHSSVPQSHPYQSQMNHQTLSLLQIAYNSPQPSTQPLSEFPQMDSCLVVPVFNQGDDPIACLNKAMAFLTAVASSRFPSTNNQLRTSSNPRNQVTIQDGSVTVQQARVVKCYNCQGESHMARQFTQPKRHRNVAWFKEKAMLAEAREAGQILDEEQLAFFADPGILDGQATQKTIPNTVAFQTEHLDAYDPECDDVSNVKTVLMANLSSYGFDVLLELMNIVSKFLSMVRFGNDQIAKIMGYGGYQLGNVIISRAEAINTTSYTQNRSLIRLRYNKTPYKPMHDKKPDLSFLYVFGSLCYLTNNSEDLGKLNAKADIAMAFEQFGSGPGLQSMTPATTSSGLVPNPIPQQHCNPPNRDDWDPLFQPMFDKYVNPPTIVVSPVPVVAAPRAVDITESPVSMSIDLDAPSTNIPMVEKNNLDEELQGTPVDATLYCGMIGSLMYLTFSRPDLIYVVCLCARYQEKPTEKHLDAVKQIFQYLKRPLTWVSEEELVTFIQKLGYSGKFDMLSAIHTDQMHQLWRTVATIINRCISGKTTELDRLRESRAQILEISLARKEHMPCPRFTKVIISHFISNDKTIYMRNMINLYTICDDTLLDIKDYKAYKTYLKFATGKATPKKARKFEKVASPSRKLSPVLEEEPAEKPKRAKKPAKKSATVPKKKTSAKVDKGKGMDLLSDTTDTDEGTRTKPRVPDVPKYSSESKNESWGDSGDDGDDNDDNNDKVTKDDDDDDDEVDSDADDENEASEKTAFDKDDKEKENKEEYVRSPDSFEFNDNDEEHEELYKDVNVRLTDTKHEEQGEEDEEMTDVGRDDSTQQTKYEQVKDDEHVTLTTVHDTQKNEVVSMMNVKVRHEEPSTPTPPLLNIHVTIKSQIPTMVDAQLSTRLGDSIKESFRSYTVEFEKKAKDERKRYIDLVEKSMKKIIKDEVKSQLLEILPKEVSNYATPVIQSSIIESLENTVLVKSSSQPKSRYEATTSLTEFELKKILLDKIQESKSYRGAQENKDLYDALVKSYKLDKDLFESYGKVYSLKRDREDKDKDKDPLAESDQGLKKQKTSKDVEPSRGSKSKESKSSSSKGTKSQPKSSGKSAQAKEPILGSIKIVKVGKHPLTFDELMSTLIDFSAYVLNNLKIENLTQEYIVGPAFNLLRGTCKSQVELEYHFEECYKAVTDRLDWTNPKGHEYPFDLSKPLTLIEYQGRQVVLANYLINNDLKYMKGGSLSRKYTTSTTKTKAAKYDTIEGVEDMVPSLWSPVKKKLSNLERDDLFELNVALQMFTRRVVLLKQVVDLQPGVKSYKKKLNITRPETFRLMRYDELYKLCDGILSSVRRVRHDIAFSLKMDYLPKRRWSKLDRKRSRIMIKAIDQKLFKRRLIRNLKKFVGGRDYGNDPRLLERTI
nr:hypothetical protein [Tanacetum cinerariifolium]